MASVHSAFASAVCNNSSHSLLLKLPSTSFLPGFDVAVRTCSAGKNEMLPCLKSIGPKATLTFDPSTTNTEKTKQKKHTVYPAAPDFLPLPSFEQCFPKSSKKYRFA